MRGEIDTIRARGAELVIVGNGSAHFARAFRADFSLDGPILVDPELRAYRAAGLRRGRVEAFSPKLAVNAVRALRAGARQQGVQGDPWQLGGVFVIRPDGDLTYAHASTEAGDHPPISELLAALAPDAPVATEELPASAATRLVGTALSRVVDPGIVFSFDRTGHRIHSLSFEPGALDVDLSRRRFLVTGANSGIGFAASLALADLGAEVVLLCRNALRGEAAAEQIRASTGNPNVQLELLDVSDLAAVGAVAAKLGSQPVDGLVHNAGVLPDERIESAQGLELTFATHVAGPFLLTRLLRPALEKAASPRVVWVSSGGMYTRRLQLEDPNWEQRAYDGVVAYAETKRAQVVLAELFAERLGPHVVVNAMHPGWVDTPSVRRSLPGFYRLTRPILRTPEEGADTVVWLAASARAGHETGGFFLDRERRRTHLLPFTRETAADREALWRLCEEVVAAGDALPRGRRSAILTPRP